MPTIDDREALSYFSLFVNDIQIFDTKEEIPSKKNQYHCCKLFLRVNKKKKYNLFQILKINMNGEKYDDNKYW